MGIGAACSGESSPEAVGHLIQTTLTLRREGFNRYLAKDMRGATLRYLEGADCGYEVGHAQDPCEQLRLTDHPTFVLIGRANKRSVSIGPVTVVEQ